MKKPYFFSISTKQFHSHHFNKELWPNWTVSLPASCHMVISAWQEKPVTEGTLADLRGFLDALEMIYLLKRRDLDEKDALLDRWIEISKNENKRTDK